MKRNFRLVAIFPPFIALAMLVSCLCQPAFAQAVVSPVSAGTVAPAPATVSLPDCNAARPQAPPNGNQKVKLYLDPDKWVPPGGTVKFTMTGNELGLATMKVIACFRLTVIKFDKDGKPEAVPEQTDWEPTQPVEVIDTAVNKITYGAVVPVDFLVRKFDWWQNRKAWWANAAHAPYDGWGLVPISDLRVMAHNGQGWTELDVVRPIGLSSRIDALLVSAIVMIGAWAALLRWAASRGIEGDWILRLVANKYHYASLSQFQITLWTFLFSGGAIYVMVLSGELIDIPSQALMLLGIPGIATLAVTLPGSAAAITTPPAGQSQTASAPATPGVVTGVMVVGRPDATSLVLIWQEPDGGTQTASYGVEQAIAGADAWVAASGGTTTETYCQIIGLTASAAYRFRVVAIDASTNRGTPSQPVSVTMMAASGGAAPAAPMSLGAIPPVSQDTVTLGWTAPSGIPAPRYLVQYREAGRARWFTASQTVDGTGYALGGLVPSATYEFRVAGIANGQVGPWSNPAVGTTASRKPKWADLVVWDGKHEVDVTRVQVLMFTLVTAGFVILRIGTKNEIPEIPASIVLLMGLSNGIYVTAKFIPQKA